jgi:hypothetical protein
MAVVQPPDQPVEQILLQELERVDEMLLQELERVDETLLRIVAAIDQLPERIASVRRRNFGPVSGNVTSAADPARAWPSTRSFDPYEEDDVEAAEDKKSAATQVARKVHSWVTANAPDGQALGLATLSVAIAFLATAIALVGLIVAVV